MIIILRNVYGDEVHRTADIVRRPTGWPLAIRFRGLTYVFERSSWLEGRRIYTHDHRTITLRSWGDDR